jgi:MFS-type transporter involved in bile tolerance (Atg22 family)
MRWAAGKPSARDHVWAWKKLLFWCLAFQAMAVQFSMLRPYMTTRTKLNITVYTSSVLMLLDVFSKPLHIPDYGLHGSSH